WQQNKGGYVGYTQVNEVYEENGRVEHYFTTPNEYRPEQPEMKRLYLKYNRVLRWSQGIGNIKELNQSNLSYHPTMAPLIARDWRLGLEKSTKTFREGDDFLLSETNTQYDFVPMLGEKGIMYHPTSDMYQYLHYGSINEVNSEAILYQVVDGITSCPTNLFSDLVRYFFKFVFTEHPYRYIEKNFPHAKCVIESQKVEIRSSQTISYFDDGSSNNAFTSYKYEPDEERKIQLTTQSYSTGQSTSTSYRYADNLNANGYDFLDQGVLDALDDLNFEAPIHTISKVNGSIVGGGITDYANYSDGSPGGRYLVESVWSYREDSLALTGVFDTYDNTSNTYGPTWMPTKYRLAKYGTGYNIATYDFFPPITMEWNKNLQMTSRTINEGDPNLSFTTSSIINNLCQTESTTDANGLQTTYLYDNRRRLEKTTSPGGLQEITNIYSMNPFIVTTSTEFMDGSHPDQGQAQHMDGWGNVLKVERITDGAILTSTIYDDLFRPKEQFQLGSGTTQIKYEPSPLGRVVETIDAVGNTTTTEYLGPDIPNDIFNDYPCRKKIPPFVTFAGTKVKDPNDHISYGWVDGFGKGTVSVSGEGGITVSEYDSRERIKKITNPICEEYKYTYNPYTGLLASKTIPNGGTQRYWYDTSLRMVFKTDANGNNLAMDYDPLYRLTTIGYGGDLPSGSPSGVPLPEGNVSLGQPVMQNTYADQKTWIEQTKEGILEGNSIIGQKIVDLTLDNLGRVESTNTTYTNTGYTIEESFTPLDNAGISEVVNKIVSGPSTEALQYTFGFDDLLRPTTTSVSHNGDISKLIQSISFNELDQVQGKGVGYAGGSGFLQNVDYTYDGAGRLIRINDPAGSACISEAEVCQLFWGTAGIDFGGCGDVTGFTLDGTYYGFPTAIAPSEEQAIEDFVNQKIKELGKLGSVEVHYEEIPGGTDMYVSFMNTAITSARIHFQECTYTFTQKDCCVINAIGGTGTFPVPGTPAKADLFFEEITYSGLDISMIEMAGSCAFGLIKNQYVYDADHRLKEVHNSLFRSGVKEGGALFTSYTYDLAGNIQTLKRRGWVPEENKFMDIDDLIYKYQEFGDGYNSKLLKILDKYDATLPNYSEYAQPVGFKGRLDEAQSAGVAEYGYDGNGNLIKDSGKEAAISYNLLNLPASITTISGSITHQYTFGGEKIKKNGEEVREYLGGVEYKNGATELISIPDGRILKEGNFQYHLTDHLGNVVVVFEDKDAPGTPG
ncbi:MAG: RHS repeat domain-containing protein, partial [Bacteroidota bacterium]